MNIAESTMGFSAPKNRAMILVSVMLATVMVSLDLTIANVALPHMAGSVSAAPDQISWVLTSYMAASAIFIPATCVLVYVRGQV